VSLSTFLQCLFMLAQATVGNIQKIMCNKIVWVGFSTNLTYLDNPLKISGGISLKVNFYSEPFPFTDALPRRPVFDSRASAPSPPGSVASHSRKSRRNERGPASRSGLRP